MIKVAPVTNENVENFKRLFTGYYTELDCGENIPRLLDDYILPDLLAGLIKIELLEDNGNSAGFVIYQIDDIDNDWNLKEGWGDIREIYVSPDFRRQGLGKFLLYTAEMKLKESGADKAYCLPYKSAIAFFTACGYKNTADYNEELDCFVFEKTNLNNHCCK